jgi:DNA-binding NarL/FixJ family response regulator
MKILLVEDQTPTLHFLEQFCKEIHPSAHVKLCSNHEKAMKHLHDDDRFDLLVADLDFDGDKRFAIVELAKELQIPCIVYSAFYKPTFVRKAFALEVSAFISKLGQIEDLKFAIESYQTLKNYACSFITEHMESRVKLDVQELILTPAEHKILSMLVQGMDRKEMAVKFKIQQATLNGYIKDIKNKNNLGLAELVRNYVYWYAQ